MKDEILLSVSEETANPAELLPEYLEPGADLWTEEFLQESDFSEDMQVMAVLVQWILKCSCLSEASGPSSITNNTAVHRFRRYQ